MGTIDFVICPSMQRSKKPAVTLKPPPLSRADHRDEDLCVQVRRGLLSDERVQRRIEEIAELYPAATPRDAAEAAEVGDRWNRYLAAVYEVKRLTDGFLTVSQVNDLCERQQPGSRRMYALSDGENRWDLRYKHLMPATQRGPRNNHPVRVRGERKKTVELVVEAIAHRFEPGAPGPVEAGDLAEADAGAAPGAARKARERLRRRLST